MAHFRKKFPKPPKPSKPSAATAEERIRAGTVEHDHRGNATLKWYKAPPGDERTPLELDDSSSTQRHAKVRGGIEVQSSASGESFHPYHRPLPKKKSTATTGKRDLRKLSEWIKMMRDREEKQRRGDDKDKHE